MDALWIVLGCVACFAAMGWLIAWTDRRDMRKAIEEAMAITAPLCKQAPRPITPRSATTAQTHHNPLDAGR